MANAAVIFILYLIGSGGLPDLTAVAQFPSQAACQSAAADVTKAISSGQNQKLVVCVSADSLDELAKKNDISGK